MLSLLFFLPRILKEIPKFATHYTLPAHIILLELSQKRLPKVLIMMLHSIQCSLHYLHITGRMELVLLTTCPTVANLSWTASCIPNLLLVGSAMFQLRVSMYFAGRTLTRLQSEVKSVSTASLRFVLQAYRPLPGMFNLL
jgi:hypothetical protein